MLVRVASRQAPAKGKTGVAAVRVLARRRRRVSETRSGGCAGRGCGVAVVSSWRLRVAKARVLAPKG